MERASITYKRVEMMFRFMRKLPLLPWWVNLWFFVSCAVLSIGGIADEMAGKEQEGLNAWGAALGISVMYFIVLILWWKRSTLRSFTEKIPLPLVVTSVLIGWTFAEIDELVNFPFNPLVPGITLAQDILFTTPIYLLAHAGWYHVLRRYVMTPTEALIVGGASLGIYEVLSGGGAAVLLFIPFWPFIIMIHGVHMIVPKILLSGRFDEMEQKNGRRKYVLGILLPAIGAGIGVLIAGILALLMGVSI